MTGRPRRSCVASLLGPVAVSAGLCVVLSGCGTLSSALPSTPQLLSIPSLKSASNTDSAAFKKKVENDPFPTGSHMGEILRRK